MIFKQENLIFELDVLEIMKIKEALFQIYFILEVELLEIIEMLN